MINGCDFIHMASMIYEVAYDVDIEGIWCMWGMNKGEEEGYPCHFVGDKRKKEEKDHLKKGTKVKSEFTFVNSSKTTL